MPYRPTERTKARKAETRERIVSAALDQLAEGGYASASVQAVASRAGVATGSVYRYFPSKSELFAEVFRRASAREVEVFAETMAGAFQAALKRRRESGAQAAEVRALGPAEAPVFRLKDYFRYHFQLQSPSPGELHTLIREVWPTLRPPSGIEFTLDVDPFNMQ